MKKNLQNQSGFTIIELMMVMIILAILTQMAMTFTLDMRKRAYDAVALADGKNLMTAAANTFIGLEDVDFYHEPEFGPEIGSTTFTDGAPREPVYNLSNGVQAVITGESGITAGSGTITAFLYHENGTNDATASGKREFYFFLDEMTSVITAPEL